MNNPTRRTVLFFAVFLIFSMAFASAFDLGDWMKGLFSGKSITGKVVDGVSSDGLVANYNFSDVSISSSGTLSRDAYYINEGIDGKALSLNGSGRYSFASNINLDANAITFGFWFKTRDAYNVRRIVEHSWDTGGVFTSHIYYGNVVGGLQFRDGTSKQLATTNRISANTWNHFVVNYDGNTMKLYLNGQDAGSAVVGKELKTASKTLYMGGVPGVSFNGSIDEVFIYKKALSADDIKKIYDGERSRLVIAPTPGTGGGGGGGGTVVELKDRCSELSDSLKTNMSRVKEQAKKNGYNFVMEEGINLSLYDYIMVYSINSPNKARILQLVSIGGGTSSIDKTTFQDVNTVESFDFTTGVSNASTRNIDGYTFYVATLSKFGSGISAIITWGDGASYGNVGKQKDTFDCSVPEPPAQCKDSDGGKDYYVKGVLNGGLEDYCMSDLLSVREYYCDSSVKEGFSNEFYKCPQGCKDGACVKAGVEGEEYINLATSSKKLYMGDSINAVRRVITKNELPNLLADGSAVDQVGAVYNYVQSIEVGGSKIEFSNSNERDLEQQPLIQIGNSLLNPIFNYTLTFVKELNVTDTVNVVGTAKLRILGKDYIVAGGDGGNLYLVLDEVELSIDVGENKIFSLEGLDHSVSLKGTTSTTAATIVVDGIQKSVNKGGTYKFSGGFEVYVKDVYHATKTGTLSNVNLIVGKQLLLNLMDEAQARAGSDETTVLNTFVDLFNSNGKLTKFTISQAAEHITKDHIPVGGEYVDRVFGGDLRVRFESYDSNTKMAEILLGKFITPIKPPTPPQVCSELIDKVKTAKDFTDDSGNKYTLSWNQTYEGNWWLDNKNYKFTSYGAGWQNSYYNDNEKNLENQYNYLNIEILKFDDENVNTEDILKDEITRKVCQVNGYYDSNNKLNNVYVCNWNVLRNEQSLNENANSKFRQIIWPHENILVRIHIFNTNYLNDEQLNRFIQNNLHDFLKDLKSNDYKFGLWRDFDITYPLSNQVYLSLRQCSSTLSEQLCTSSWNCKIEPAICPPHGEQKQICIDLNRCSGQEIQEQTISCSPGICSGCYIPRWVGLNNGDNICVPYGIRLAQEREEDKEKVEEAVDLGADGSVELNITVIDSEKAYIYAADVGISSMVYVGGVYKFDENGDVGSFRVDKIIPSSGSKKGYLELTIFKRQNVYCDIDGKIKAQRQKEPNGEWASCQNNYECESNVCSGGQCVEVNDIIKDAKGIKVLLFKALCRITNLFSDDGYKQCLIENLGEGVIEPKPPVSSEVDLSSSKYLINKKFEGLEISQFDSGKTGLLIDDVAENMPEGFEDGETAVYRGIKDQIYLQVLVLRYNEPISFERFDGSIGKNVKDELGSENVKYLDADPGYNKNVLFYKSDDKTGYVWASNNFVIWVIVEPPTTSEAVYNNVLEVYYNKYISSLEGSIG